MLTNRESAIVRGGARALFMALWIMSIAMGAVAMMRGGAALMIALCVVLLATVGAHTALNWLDNWMRGNLRSP